MVAVVAVLTALAALTACSRTPVGDPSLVSPVASQPTMQPDDVVDLTVYFRSGEGSKAFLVPVTKEAAIDHDLPRRALELLIAGPTDEDGRGLRAPLPDSTAVRDLRVEDDVAYVDVSHHIISQGADANPSPQHEALALAAIVGTLTEFPAVEQVRLSVEGHQRGWRSGVDVGRFWGWWGLPEVLVPDDSVMSEPAEGEGIPDLERFTAEPQTVGSDSDVPLAVTSVRTRDRTTYMRIMVQLDNLDDPDSSATVPPARVRRVGERIVLEIDDVTVYDADFAPGQRLRLDDPVFDEVAVEETDRDDRVRIVLTPVEPRVFWLHTLSSPTRIVLDVKK